ncbi:Ig-like domain repeat protein [Streptomyces sp. GC420]|nr:Ig-like domain repeat protein [Streptomyces sp. GC420]
MTSVSSSPDPSVFGQPVLFTATVAPVAPGAGTPTGTVTFTIDGDVVPVLLDENGTATLTRATLPAGTYSVTADYGGDTNFTASTGTDTHTVVQAATLTTVTSSPDPSVRGETVTLTATVAAVSPGAGTPTGTVTFTISGGPTIPVALNADGVATVDISTLTAGTYSITAAYGGDSNFTASTGTDTHTVNPAPTTTTVISSPDPSVVGETVTFTATVTPDVPGPGTPTGTVTFVIDGTVTLTAPITGGSASVTYSGLNIGPHTVTASYGGDADFAPSSGADTHTVTGASTITTVVSSPDPSQPGRLVTFTATVVAAPPGTGTPTGTVTFVIGGGGGGTFTAALVGGVAVTTNRGLTIGPHAVTATYNGNGQFAPSTGTDTHTVAV